MLMLISFGAQQYLARNSGTQSVLVAMAMAIGLSIRPSLVDADAPACHPPPPREERERGGRREGGGEREDHNR